MLGISKVTPQHEALAEELRAGVTGEVRVDQIARGLYATDASIYQLEPVAVVIPRSRGDVAHALAVARRRGLKVLPRGGGTSLAGQAAGRALVIDYSKYLNRILEVNVEERWARVEPGRVRDELNAEIVATGLHFAPETATSNRANVGGMIGNNSSGTKSIIYGKTIDHVLELTVLLPTGEELWLRPMSRAEWDDLARKDDREGGIYRGVAEIVAAHREEILARYPKVMRRVGGYNLDEFVKAEAAWNLAHLVVGSEGTLAAVVEAKLRLAPLPPARAAAVAHFRRLPEALRAAPIIVARGPSAVELLDQTILRLARQNLEIRRICDWIEGEPAAVLLIEFFGGSPSEIAAKLDAVEADLRGAGLGYAFPRMFSADEQKKLWDVRAAGLGLMLGMKGDAKPTPFIEDAAVPVERLAEYIEAVLGVCRELDVPVSMYAHASVGLIHVRPILDLKRLDQIEKMRTISERTFELVRKYGGSWSGEHGDGLVRSYMNERFFGPKLYAAFKEIKRLFDPDGMMNPGKIVDAPPMDQDLRFGPQYRAQTRRTFYHFREDGGLDRAVELCTGVGACRKTLGGTMCPSYIATRDEDHSTRGRANALRLAITGQLGLDGLAHQGLHEVMDLCLGCKACKAECPSNVDVARLKGEFLAQYHTRRGIRWSESFFARSAQMAARLSGREAPVVNWLAERASIRAALELLVGLDRRRPLPRLAREPFHLWYARRRRREPASPGGAPRVVLFDDTFLNYHEPWIGRAAVELLERLGYRVEPAGAGCCCRPLISHGFLQEARDLGRQTLARLNRFATERLPIVVCEPSCLSALTDDLPDLIEDAQLGKRVASAAVMIDAFLERELQEGRLAPEKVRAATVRDRAAAPRYLIHGHCHQKALFGTRGMTTLLGLMEGAEVTQIEAGCCGMAGSFGYEKRHYDVSLRVGEDRLFPAIRRMSPQTTLVACGFSCRHQIADVLGVRAVHFVEALGGPTEGRGP